MDIRENVQDFEEVIRACFAGLLKNVWTAMPVRVTQDTDNGHVAVVQPTIKRRNIDPETGETAYVDHPLHPDTLISHAGGGGVSHTFPTKQGDTGAVIYAARAIDSWVQSDGTQQPIDGRMHSLADAIYVPGARSQPRMLHQVEKDAAQLRSDDKHHTISHHPQTGTHVKSVDPGTPPASLSFDPYKQATRFFEHLVHGAAGVFHNAVDGGTKHAYSLTHSLGHLLEVANGKHSVSAHPDEGAKLMAEMGKHVVQAHPQAGLMLKSPTGISLDTPSLSLPPGSIPASALKSDALAGSVGNLGGDLSGTLPSPNVVSIAHVTNAHNLRNAASDSAAAGQGVAVGSLYRNGSTLMVRVA